MEIATALRHPECKHWRVLRYTSHKRTGGLSFSCVLTYDNVVAGLAENDGEGGKDRVFVRGTKAQQSFKVLREMMKDQSGVLTLLLTKCGI